MNALKREENLGAQTLNKIALPRRESNLFNGEGRARDETFIFDLIVHTRVVEVEGNHRKVL